MKWIDKTFWKFILVGIANTVFGTAIMFGFYNILKCDYWVSSAANYLFASVLSYFLNKYFTFKNTARGWRPVLRFTINIICCYGIAYGLAKPMMMYFLSGFTQQIQDNGAMLVGMVLFVLLNYCGQRFFAFKNEE